MKIKYVVIIMVCLFVIGCAYQKVDHAKIEKKALQFCEDKGGVDYIRERCPSVAYIKCLNGDYEYGSNITIDKYSKPKGTVID